MIELAEKPCTVCREPLAAVLAEVGAHPNCEPAGPCRDPWCGGACGHDVAAHIMAHGPDILVTAKAPAARPAKADAPCLDPWCGGTPQPCGWTPNQHMEHHGARAIVAAHGPWTPGTVPSASQWDEPAADETGGIPLLTADQRAEAGMAQPVPPAAPEPAQPAVRFAAPAGRPSGPVHPLKAELMEVIGWHDANKPRSLQRRIGPSEVGVACLRRLGYSALGTEPANTSRDPWFAIVGSAVHDWLAVALDSDNAKRQNRFKWLVEERLNIAPGLSGSCDLYKDGVVIDHKVLSSDNVAKYRTDPPGQYVTQLDLYGLGHENAGRPVHTIALAMYPRSGYLRDMHVWTAPYDRARAEAAVARLNSTRAVATVLGAAALPSEPDPRACAYCPFYRPGPAADATGCPGVSGTR